MSEPKYKNVSIRLAEEEHRELKILAAELGLTIKALLLMCVEKLKEDKGK
ncbi:hypothetical protein [Desulfonatronovibrio magnus]|nr:hypothetical protein [Desulfonatronovibrio magnus]